jgi:hypothetical protein
VVFGAVYKFTDVSEVRSGDRPDGGSKQTWNVGELLPNYTALQLCAAAKTSDHIWTLTASSSGTLKADRQDGAAFIDGMFIDDSDDTRRWASLRRTWHAYVVTSRLCLTDNEGAAGSDVLSTLT